MFRAFVKADLVPSRRTPYSSTSGPGNLAKLANVIGAASSNARRRIGGAIVVLLVASRLTSPSEAANWVPEHVVIVVEENLSYGNLRPELKYLNELGRSGASFTNSHGIDHPSQPNYLAFFSGDTQGTGSEAIRNSDGSNPVVNGRTKVGSNETIKHTPLSTPNLGAALLQKGRSFAGFSEDLPSTGYTGDSFVGSPGSRIDYQRKHNPWVNWQAASEALVRPNQLSSMTNLPLSAFPTEEAGFANLPTVAFVIPNQINDGHQSTAAPAGTDYGKAMDDWLNLHIEAYRRWALTHNSLLIITWDEDEDEYLPVKDQNGTLIAKKYTNHVPTIMLGQGVVPGTYGDYIDHYSVLRTIQDFYGISPFAAGDAKARVITDVFRSP
jgi:acid phosphatase